MAIVIIFIDWRPSKRVNKPKTVIQKCGKRQTVSDKRQGDKTSDDGAAKIKSNL